MNISALGRCIDQPIILNKLHQKMPALLIGAGAGYGIYDTIKSTKGDNKKLKRQKAVKNLIIIGTTVAASLVGARGLRLKSFSFLGKKISLKEKQLIPALLPSSSMSEVLVKQNKAIDTFLSETQIKNKEVLDALTKARKHHLSVKETTLLLKEIPESESKKKLFDTILPEAENLDARGIFSEIGRLSLLGAIPVVGGIVGGVTADKVTKTETPKSVSNKIKEGFYQYFANIFLCNVGACAALFSAERLQVAKVIKPLTPVQRLLVILSGITATGIVGGSYIANKMSQKIIDPIFNKEKCLSRRHKGVYDERKPELTDIALHADDIATAGVLSGFKWIEPALPFMYFVSGYRAGIGYRNNSQESV